MSKNQEEFCRKRKIPILKGRKGLLINLDIGDDGKTQNNKFIPVINGIGAGTFPPDWIKKYSTATTQTVEDCMPPIPKTK